MNVQMMLHGIEYLPISTGQLKSDSRVKHVLCGQAGGSLGPDAFDGWLTSTRTALGDESFEVYRAMGRAMPVHQAVAEATAPAQPPE